MLKRYVVFYGKKKQGVIFAGTKSGALAGAFEQYGKHRRDRVHVFRYAVDLLSKKRNKTRK